MPQPMPGQNPAQANRPQPHPLFQGRHMLNQLPATQHTSAAHQLMQHAVPIFHQLTALKKALGSGKTGEKGNPGGMSNAI